jgi:hypothetical protein
MHNTIDTALGNTGATMDNVFATLIEDLQSPTDCLSPR